MSTAVEVSRLYKSYGANQVIKGVSFEVKKGESFALLGTNGAGKTTTLECIEGIRKYESGSIRVEGKIGVQLQSSSLPENIKAFEAITLFAKWNGARTDSSMLAALGVDEIKTKQYRDMSTGQKRRLHLALALLGDPDVIFLDEPTAGLDVEGRIALHEQIKGFKQKGKTVILASHDMAEVEALCDRIAILREGKIGFIGTRDELTEKIGKGNLIRIITSGGEERIPAENIGETLLETLEGYRQKNIAVSDIKIERASLEELFMNIARGELQ